MLMLVSMLPPPVCSKLRHKNIVMLVGVCTDPRNLAIITEWVPRGSLRDVLINPSIKLMFQDVLKVRTPVHRMHAHVSVSAAARWGVMLIIFMYM